MDFPVELERVQEGKLAFKIREGTPVSVDAIEFGPAFEMRYSGEAGAWVRQLNSEIIRLGGNRTTVNAYLKLVEPQIVQQGREYGFSHTPSIFSTTIQLYSIPQEVAQEQRNFVCDFVAQWAGK